MWPKAFQNIKDVIHSDDSAVYISLNTIEENGQTPFNKICKTSQKIVT
jgi:hypothetical protein